MNEKQFVQALEEKGLKISRRQLDQFQRYYEVLVEWNENESDSYYRT